MAALDDLLFADEDLVLAPSIAVSTHEYAALAMRQAWTRQLNSWLITRQKNVAVAEAPLRRLSLFRRLGTARSARLFANHTVASAT